MLNTILENKLGENISKVAGIPDDWNKSLYNKKTEALNYLADINLITRTLKWLNK